MRRIICIFTFLIWGITGTSALPQDSSLQLMVTKNLYIVSPDGDGFSGKGWDTLIRSVKKASNVLIGEDHFMNEVPPIVSAIAKAGKFDNFFCEVDPFTVSYLAKKIKSLSTHELEKYKKDFRDGFSFYAKKPEFELFQQLVKAGVNVFGTEQVSLFSDRLLFQELSRFTQNQKAAIIYKQMADSSRMYVEQFPRAANKTFYIMTDAYGERLKQLDRLLLHQNEKEILYQIKLSRQIYLQQNHHLRIQLMKEQLLLHYNKLATQRNLFKYGANHMCRGESFLRIYDLGNLIHNISDSRFEQSLHIMIVGKSGSQGSGIPGMPANALDPENGELNFLQPFFQAVKGTGMHCFLLTPIRKEIERGNIHITNKLLLRTINGYDWLIILPEVTAAEHF